MNQPPNPSSDNLRWGDVRKDIHAQLERTKDALVTAPPDRVPVLQGQAQALAALIQWFEHGAIAALELSLSAQSPTP